VSIRSDSAERKDEWKTRNDPMHMTCCTQNSLMSTAWTELRRSDNRWIFITDQKTEYTTTTQQLHAIHSNRFSRVSAILCCRLYNVQTMCRHETWLTYLRSHFKVSSGKPTRPKAFKSIFGLGWPWPLTSCWPPEVDRLMPLSLDRLWGFPLK